MDLISFFQKVVDFSVEAQDKPQLLVRKTT